MQTHGSATGVDSPTDAAAIRPGSSGSQPEPGHVFPLLFCDGGGKRDDQELVIDLLQPGGLVVLDDFTVSSTWPPIFAGQRDRVREHWLTHPQLLANEVLTTATSTTIIGVKRP